MLVAQNDKKENEKMEDERMEQEPGSSSAGGFKDPRKRNILIVAIAARRERANEKKFSELERVWEKYNVYEKQVEL